MRNVGLTDLSSSGILNYSNKFAGVLRVSFSPLHLTIIYEAGKIRQR